ncbi:guanylate kinase [Blattabacterium cuenoti]|uniref:guanylate kinase n=1 Tax=Blattabacterium cuenoti TaxID=1653831 RepID=UPI00163B88FE|nr:guanylate kinase [Blattabacterium cuenoti]
MKKRKVIILSGSSGSGKTTISQYLLSKISNLKLSISCTTRTIRKNEKNGKDYYFISKKNFFYKIKKYQFIEWEEVYDNSFYGTLKNELYKIWREGKHVLFDVDVKGGLKLKRIFKKNSLSIFISVISKKILEERLINRESENMEKIKIRLKRAEKENIYSDLFDFIIENNDLKTTKNKILKIVYNFI